MTHYYKDVWKKRKENVNIGNAVVNEMRISIPIAELNLNEIDIYYKADWRDLESCKSIKVYLHRGKKAKSKLVTAHVT